MWPSKNTALLVIHGIGEQNPYETLDGFVRNFWDYLQNENQKANANTKVTGHHLFKPRVEWVEDYVNLELKNGSSKNTLNFYEYYWAYMAEGQVSISDIYEWLIKTSDGARKFYDENAEIVKKYETSKMDVGAFNKKGFKSRWYLKHLGWILRALSFIRIPKIPYADALIRFLLGKGKSILIDYLGDVVLYTSADIKSKNFEIRKKILDGAVSKIKDLLLDERNEQVIIAGHSLGSVIAYDALNRINHEMNTDSKLAAAKGRLTGFVTFGSPLDKIAFFFREHTDRNADIRRQLLAHFHGFKSIDLSSSVPKHPLSNPYISYLDHVFWLNFWHTDDPVSGHLDFYKVSENIELDLQKPWGVTHIEYWEHIPMYEKIAGTFFVGTP